MRNYPSIGIQVPDLLFPNKSIDYSKWSVIACDQFTSQMNYWDKVKATVGDSPSTYHLILPEVYLGKPEEEIIAEKSHQFMHQYLTDETFNKTEGMVYVKRETSTGIRSGLLLALDLEKYDFNKGSKTLIRASEGTILERLPPRIRIRENASLELPHILVLIDDPERTVIEPITDHLSRLPKIYDFDLMFSSGHLEGFLIDNLSVEKQVLEAFTKLASKHHNFIDNSSFLDKPLLFAVGDGNHSLATAKSVWDMKKARLGMNHPLRFALVEIENIHDDSLIFEPIHRILFNVDMDLLKPLKSFFNNTIEIESLDSFSEVIDAVRKSNGPFHVIGIVQKGLQAIITIKNPISNLAVGSIQGFLDSYLSSHKSIQIDYIHGTDTFHEICQQSKNTGFFLPPMKKDDLFKTIILDGALPRKTFSMGEAKDKRFYLECRQIQDLLD